jgi:glutamate carboxypeptidase
MADTLERALRIAGFSPDIIHPPGSPAPILRVQTRPYARQQVLLCGHYDTVYPADHPFQRCRQRTPDRLNGPGVADMKGGIVVMLAALQAFEKTAAASAVGWEILLTPDEEVGSPSSAAVLIEAGNRHHLGLVFEPGRENGDVVLARKGIGAAVVTSHGRASHAGTAPHLGRNAIFALAEFLTAANEHSRNHPGVQLSAGRVSGGGPLNVVPNLAVAELDLRVDSAAAADALTSTLRNCALPINQREGHRIEVDVRFGRPPMEATDRSTRLFEAYRSCADELRIAGFSWQAAGGGSDANLLHAAGLPCLDGLGPFGGAFHSEDEWIDVRSLAVRAQLAALFLYRLSRPTVRGVS